MEARSSGSPKDNLNRTLADLLLRIFHNRGIAGEEKTGRVLIEISWFVPVDTCPG
jgi:hypothetical protein